MYCPTVLLSIPNSLAIWLLFILIDVPSISDFNLYKSFTDSIFISVITVLLIINEVLLLLHDNSFVHFYLAHFVHLLLSLNKGLASSDYGFVSAKGTNRSSPSEHAQRLEAFRL